VTFRALCSFACLVFACGDDSSLPSGESGDGGADTEEAGSSVVIQEDVLSGEIDDEPWEFRRGRTTGLTSTSAVEVELCDDDGMGCEPCEGWRAQFLALTEPGEVAPNEEGFVVLFYDGTGSNVDASLRRIRIDEVSDDTIDGGLYAAYEFSYESYELSGEFSVRRCE
jgi:hypothetical protein